MALARNISTFDRTEGNTVRALPSYESERAQRPAVRTRKAKRSVGSVLLGALGWLTVLALCLFVVHRNTMVLAESSSLTLKREAIAKLGQQISEKQTHLTVPIGDLEKWATAHSMQRPTTIKTVAADPTVVVPAPVTQATVAVAQPIEPSFNLFSAVKGYLAKLSVAGRSALGSK